MAVARDATYLKVDGQLIRFSNLRKVLYPGTGFTKMDMLRYYKQISKALLPHLRGRALTLKRYPEGVEEEPFYEKRCPSYRPDYVDPVEHQGIQYCSASNLATLLWVANLSSIELHTVLSRGEAPEQPDFMAFDLDPGTPADVLDCARAALIIREALKSSGLESFAKTSGSKGLQLYVPLNSPTTYDDTKEFSRALAERMEARHGRLMTSKMKKALRPGKVFIDWSQNDINKTTVTVYSLRARERPTVSTPVTWKEIERAARENRRELLEFTAPQVLARVKRLGDLFEPVLTLRQELPSHRALRRAA
jgi:bifunctional non-homologous end joining protein LigD